MGGSLRTVLLLQPTPLPHPAQILLLDADDTLWENNVHFERAVASFVSFLAHETLGPDEVRAVLNDVQRRNLAVHGYGSRAFAHALVETFAQLSKEPLTPALQETLHGFAHAIAEMPIELIAGVPETLAHLRGRHRLLLVTKGNHAEQAGKVARSGLAGHFEAVEIVPEKDPATYRALVERHRLAPEATWMVGNSPRSDVNPALAAGLNAVFVPHPLTWIVEHAPLAAPPPGRALLELRRFADLAEHF